MRQRGHMHTVQTTTAFEGQVALGLLHLCTALAKLLEHGLHVIRARTFQGYLTLSCHSGNRVGGRLNTIGNHLMLGPSQLLDSGDCQSWRSNTVNLRTHAAKKISQVHHFGFAGRLFDDCDAFGQRSRHHRVGSPQHGGTGAATQKHFATDKFTGFSNNVAFVDLHLGPQRFHGFAV